MADVTWTGGGDGSSWSDGDNWSPSSVPQMGDTVVIPSGYSLLFNGLTPDGVGFRVEGTAVLTLDSFQLGDTSPVGAAITFTGAGFLNLISCNVAIPVVVTSGATATFDGTTFAFDGYNAGHITVASGGNAYMREGSMLDGGYKTGAGVLHYDKSSLLSSLNGTISLSHNPALLRYPTNFGAGTL